MYAYAGMKLEEWEDGQVNIGIAVCPQKRTAVAIEQENGTILSSNNNEPIARKSSNFIVPKSAFIVRPPEKYCQSQGGFSVTYAHQRQGNSDFVIMLNSQDHDQGYLNDKVISRLEGRKNYLSREIVSINTPMKNSEEREGAEEKEVDTKQIAGEVERVNTSESSEAAEEEKVEKVESREAISQEEEEKELKSSKICGKEFRANHRSPQDTSKTSSNEDDEGEEIIEHDTSGIVEVIVTSPRKEKTKSPNKNPSQSERKSSDCNINNMKRVSWGENREEKFSDEDRDKKGSAHINCNSKENKRESGRKSKGSSHRRSSSSNRIVKEHGFNSAEDSPTTIAGYTAATTGGRSGDKSRIPGIAPNGAAGDYPSSCEYYRRKMLREYVYNDNPSTLADNWYDYTSLQKYAGQKVVKKMTEEQKRLEEDISNRRKTEIWILGSDPGDDFLLMSPALPLRKKTTRLKPLQLVQ